MARREKFLRAKDSFPGVEFVNPDFKTMDCEIVVEDIGRLTGKLVEELHQKCGFRRLLVREILQPDGENPKLKQLGFLEQQRVPMTWAGERCIPLLLQPYGEVRAYEAVFAKNFP